MNFKLIQYFYKTLNFQWRFNKNSLPPMFYRWAHLVHLKKFNNSSNMNLCINYIFIFTEKITYLTADQYISTYTESLRSSRVNIIQFRFRTNQPSALILYHGRKMEHVIIELVNGNVELTMRLGTGKENLFKNYKISISCRKIFISLTG